MELTLTKAQTKLHGKSRTQGFDMQIKLKLVLNSAPYICRFVLTDISILLDKFIKRGSEWVLV
jgi:hypothetical protein